MQAKMKCSNCGAELSALNVSGGWKPFLIMVPFMLLGFLPLLKLTFLKGDASKDLIVSEIQRRNVDGRLEILGLVTNTGSLTWSSVTIKAEFFDESGAFVDEASEYLRSDFAGNGKEHFKMTIANPTPALNAPGVKMVVKVVSGHTSPF
ncbi:MAG: FxLYD domain-containing protein [Gemmataceae bacterium]|nr:FxLYD domain-containing protein [Gemmataceae bacterium]